MAHLEEEAFSPRSSVVLYAKLPPFREVVLIREISFLSESRILNDLRNPLLASCPTLGSQGPLLTLIEDGMSPP